MLKIKKLLAALCAAALTLTALPLLSASAAEPEDSKDGLLAVEIRFADFDNFNGAPLGGATFSITLNGPHYYIFDSVDTKYDYSIDLISEKPLPYMTERETELGLVNIIGERIDKPTTTEAIYDDELKSDYMTYTFQWKFNKEIRQRIPFENEEPILATIYFSCRESYFDADSANGKASAADLDELFFGGFAILNERFVVESRSGTMGRVYNHSLDATAYVVGDNAINSVAVMQKSISYGEYQRIVTGDPTFDGKSDICDFAKVAKYIAGMLDLNGNELIAADFDRNGVVDINDLMLMIKA